MLFNSLVKIEYSGFSANNYYTGRIGRIIGKYSSSNPLEDNLYKICFENGERRNFFIWQFSIVNLPDY